MEVASGTFVDITECPCGIKRCAPPSYSRLLETQAEYEAALATLARLMESDPAYGTPDGNQLGILGLLCDDFEHRNCVW